MRLRILAPFRSHLRLSLGYTVKTGRLSVFSPDYLGFWGELERTEGSRTRGHSGAVRFLHSAAHLGPDTVRYTTIDADSLRYTAQLIEIAPPEVRSLDDGAIAETIAALGTRREAGKRAFDRVRNDIALVPDSTLIRVFDNSISLFETEMEITRAVRGVSGAALATRLDEVRDLAVFAGEALVRHYYRTVVFPLLRRVARRDEDHIYVDALVSGHQATREEKDLEPFQYPLAPGMEGGTPETEVLWVTRSLVFEAGDADQNPEIPSPVVRTWLRAVGDEALTNEVATNAEKYSTRWLNYLFREGFVARNEGESFRDVWEAMQLCQYYYSAIETLNDRLNRVLSFANQRSARESLRHLHDALDDIVRRCELVLVNCEEMQKYLKRDKLNAFRDIMGYWGFADLERAVREKMTLCRGRLKALDHQSAEKGSLYNDLLIMMLSLLTVLDMSITLALFGRSPTDTVYAQDYTYSGFIFAKFAQANPTVIVVVAFIVVVLLGLRFYFFRRGRLLYN